MRRFLKAVFFVFCLLMVLPVYADELNYVSVDTLGQLKCYHFTIAPTMIDATQTIQIPVYSYSKCRVQIFSQTVGSTTSEYSGRGDGSMGTGDFKFGLLGKPGASSTAINYSTLPVTLGGAVIGDATSLISAYGIYEYDISGLSYVKARLVRDNTQTCQIQIGVGLKP